MGFRALLIASSLITTVSAFPWWFSVNPRDTVATATTNPVSPEADLVEWQWVTDELPTEYDRFGIEFADLSLTPLQEEQQPKWFVRAEYARPTKNSLGEIATGQIDFLAGNESYCLTLGRYLKRDWGGLPLDLSLNASVCFHPSNANQEDLYQYMLWVQLQWTRFPWDDHLRTKVGVGEGLSYYEHITYSELVRRNFRPSVHLLNYLDFSLSLNMADLFAVSRLDRVFPVLESEAFEDAWLVGSLHHRSGAKGVFGDYTDEDGNEQPVKGGDNIFAIGLTMEF